MSSYKSLDDAIISAISRYKSPLYEKNVNEIAEGFAKIQEKQAYRVIDQRLQALRKSGAIKFMTRKEAYMHEAFPGWNVMPPKEES